MFVSIITGLLVVVALGTTSFAAPTTSDMVTRTVGKRGVPRIGTGFTAQQTQQIQDAFNDALQIASYARQTNGQTTDPIFTKYFREQDRNTVNAVFESIMGAPPNTPIPGNAFLDSVTIVPDYPDAAGNYACTDADTMAATRGYNTNSPRIIICPTAGFGHGGINKEYEGAPKATCEYLDENVSWKMETLGSILLHEYTHITRLVVPPLSASTSDLAYGAFEAQEIADSEDALQNADNYVWYANQVLWTVICQKSYGDPTEEDADDPNCGNSECTDETSDPDVP